MRAPTIAFPALVQAFFQRRLVAERGVSVHTLASYRDTFELLLRHAEHRTGRPPSALTLEDLTAPMILAFLDDLETARGNSPRTRNLRLTAIRSFMRYVSVRDPDRSGNWGQYLSVLNWASENGLSLETCGRPCVLVTPRSASSKATGLLRIVLRDRHGARVGPGECRA